jgi:hypothetical protein
LAAFSGGLLMPALNWPPIAAKVRGFFPARQSDGKSGRLDR